jgi:hypothetical protein
MAAKIGIRNTNNSKIEAVPEEKRWTVINAESGQRCYLASERGLTREEAEFQAQVLALETEVVPVGALDRYGRLDSSKLAEAIAIAEADPEE